MLSTPIPYGKQSVDEDDISAVIEVLKSPLLTQGPLVKQFEEKLAEYCGAKYAVVATNGTAALYLANKVLGVDEKSSVITTPNTFAATANSIALNGAKPCLVDINPLTFNISKTEIKKYLQKDSTVKGMIPVHFAGLHVDMEAIGQIAQENRLFVIEDACHALGGKWIDKNGKKQTIGNCAYSDLTVFSFHPVKHITMGEGGAITTNDKELYEKLILLRNHGITNNSAKPWAWYYEMNELSFNFRATDVQCALGLSQFKKSDQWKYRKQELLQKYDAHFDKTKLVQHQPHPYQDDLSYHLYVIQAERRDELYTYLRQNKINVQVHYIPVHYHPYYQNTYGWQKGDFPNCESYYNKALSLPLYPTLSDEAQDYVISKIEAFYHEH
jgi:UDP-4-amino-4,6-dideoxy-N-acetyl-beta-L-altrosamine transaminase